MERIITIQWSIFQIFNLGLYPLWYWSAESNNIDGTKTKEGYYIYGFMLSVLGLNVTFGLKTFKKHIRVKSFNQYAKNITIYKR